nr:Gfo/Idh/MocA family oxidoreductase [Anaerotruncus colihominis]
MSGGISVEKIRIGIIGGGWRTEFFTRIAHYVPKRFEIVRVYMRNAEKARAFTQKFNIPTTQNLPELFSSGLDYVILSVTRGAVYPFLERLFEAGIPVLCETPPAETLGELNALWTLKQKHNAKINVAEQYFLQPYHQSVLRLISDGLIGEVNSVNLSMMHQYHGMNMIRRYLGIDMENCVVRGRRYTAPTMRSCDRPGMEYTGEVRDCTREVLTLEFENGKHALFDFDNEQYFSYIRSRHLCVSGVRGEVYDTDVRYMDTQFSPVHSRLQRVDLGVYSNLEGYSHRGITLDGKFLYRNPYEYARLNDDEIAIAGCMEKMYRSLNGEPDFYPLEQSLQDSYLALAMTAALDSGEPFATTSQSWAL